MKKLEIIWGICQLLNLVFLVFFAFDNFVSIYLKFGDVSAFVFAGFCGLTSLGFCLWIAEKIQKAKNKNLTF